MLDKNVAVSVLNTQAQLERKLTLRILKMA